MRLKNDNFLICDLLAQKILISNFGNGILRMATIAEKYLPLIDSFRKEYQYFPTQNTDFMFANKICLTLLLLMSLKSFSQSNSKAWNPDLGDGRYKNPVINADYSDPDVIKVGDDYYLTASSFNCVPGLPILHSKDLVNWQIINYALPRLVPETVFQQPMHGAGVWAPSWNYHNGEFFIYYPDPDYGIYMVKTKDPSKAWSKPILVLPGKGIIDPTTLRDSDGKVYMAVAWAGSRAGVNSLITVYQLNKAGDSVIDAGKHVYDGHGIDPTIEGPKLYKLNGYYYIFAPAGGVKTGWQLVLRSKNIFGPYERKVVMDQGNSVINGPHQGAMVTVGNSYWFLHFQDQGAYGRVVHLQPMKWVNNWPVIGTDEDGDGKGTPVLSYKKPISLAARHNPAESDEFNSSSMGLPWQWHANPQITWSAQIAGSGILRLFAAPTDANVNFWNLPNLYLQKFPAESFTATAKLKAGFDADNGVGKRGGFIVMGDDYAHVSLVRTASGYALQFASCLNAKKNTAEQLQEPIPVPSDSVWIRLTVVGPAALCKFTYSIDGVNYMGIGNAFNAKPDIWIGAKMGLYCTGKPGTKNGGYIDVDWFRVE